MCDLYNWINVFVFIGAIISGIISNIYAYRISKRHLNIIDKAMGLQIHYSYNMFSVFGESEKILYAYKPEYAKNHYEYKNIDFSKIPDETRILCKKFTISNRIGLIFFVFLFLDAYFLMGYKINLSSVVRKIEIISGASIIFFWFLSYLLGIYIIKKHMHYIENGFKQTPGKYFPFYAARLADKISSIMNLKSICIKKNKRIKLQLDDCDFNVLPKKTITVCKISSVIASFLLLSLIIFILFFLYDALLSKLF